MPFIAFDADGVCNFCRHHRPLDHHGREALLEAVAPYRRRDGRPDCLVGISGGRDSCYALHVVRNELGMHPVAFTYDWGMVTDLARRNIARLCGRLGVEHILVSADIRRKRAHIRRNVAAWLRRPRLGMVPLFMAGDKAYFRVAQRLRRQVGAPLVILGENRLERTDFKTGFAGVPPALDPDHVYTLPAAGMLGFDPPNDLLDSQEKKDVYASKLFQHRFKAYGDAHMSSTNASFIRGVPATFILRGEYRP